jgi:outer membrane protein OmpA-like peptidoglycan-associated protein
MTNTTWTGVIKLGMALTAVTYWATACATKTQTGAAIGAGSGAAVGAGVGALAGGGKGAIVGGAVGAAAGATTGALIGRYMDKQEAELKKLQTAKVERQGDELIVKFNSAILFDTDKSVLKPQAKTDLTELANVLKEFKDTDLVIEGHTDSTGKKDHNKKLSVSRADAVISFLESQGVVRTRLTGKGYADERPVADNTTADGRQANRRVQVQIAANEKLKQEDAQAASGGQSGMQPASQRK